MYRRYSQVNDGSMPLSQINRNRIKNILILVLAAAVAALLVISLPLLKSRDSNRSLYIQQMQKECREALADSSTLSRTAGADSSSTLSRVRSNIHAIRTINSLSNSEGNGQLVADEMLQNMQNMVDKHLTYLTTGMDTGEYTTSLQTSLSGLQEILQTLK